MMTLLLGCFEITSYYKLKRTYNRNKHQKIPRLHKPALFTMCLKLSKVFQLQMHTVKRHEVDARHKKNVLVT